MIIIKQSTKYIWMLVMFCSMIGFPAWAQEEWDEEGEIDDAEVVIQKDRKIELPKANRSYEKVAPLPIEKTDEPQEYGFSQVDFDPPEIQPKLRVLTIKDQKLDKLYGNYVKLGLGNNASSHLEGYFNNKRSEDYSIGAHIRSAGSAKGPVDQRNSGYSELSTKIFGKYFTQPVVFTGSLGYSRNRNYFYGYTPGTEVEKDTIKQTYQKFKFQAGAEDSNNNPDLDYKFNATFGTIRDRFKAKENETGLQFDGAIRFNENLAFGWETQMVLAKRRDGDQLTRNFWRVRPTITTTIEDFKVEFGVNLVYENDTLKNNDQFHFVPVAKASYQLTEDVEVYAGVQGDVIRNSLDKFSEENPFIGPQVTIAHTVNRLEMFGGLKGTLLDALNFSTGLSLADYRNLHFYVNSAEDSTRFDIIYDTGKVPVLHLFGELGYGKSDEFLISVRGDIYAYDIKEVDKAWHRPNFEVSIFSSYNFYDKILVSGSVNAMGGLEGLNLQSDTSQKLDPIFDLNLRGEYLFSKRFSAFADIKNVASRKYSRYLNYPARGITILGGITYSF